MAELITADIDELGNFWAKAVRPFVQPVVEADRHGRPCPVGSGVLVSFQQRCYILTAHHVTARNVTGDTEGALYTFAPEQTQIGVTGLDYHYVHDPFDLSLTELPGVHCRSLRLPEHLALDVREGELSLMLGYPAGSKSWEFDRAAHTLRPGLLPYLNEIHKTSLERFSVKLSRQHCRRAGSRVQRIGKLNGISGGAVFVLRNDTPRLAGIVIEYHSNTSEIVCTSSAVVWTMVRQLVERHARPISEGK